MAQWVNRLRNNIFVNPPPLPLGSGYSYGQVRLSSCYSYGHVRISSCYSYGHVRISPCYLYGHVRIASCYSYGTQYGQASTNTFMFVRLVIAQSSRIDTWCIPGCYFIAWAEAWPHGQEIYSVPLRLCS